MTALRSLTLAVTAFALTLPGAAFAGKGKKKGPDLDAVFAKLDTNNDNKLSPAEFAKVKDELHKKKAADPNAAAKPAKKAGKGNKKLTALFAKLDTNNDGSLSKDEFKKVVEVMKEMKKDKKK